MNFHYVKNKLFLISIGLVIAGMISLLIPEGEIQRSGNLFFTKEILGVFSPGMTGLSAGSMQFFTAVSLLFYLLLTGAAIIHVRKPYKTGFIGFLWSCIFIHNLFQTVYYPFMYILSPDKFGMNLLHVVFIVLVSGTVSMVAFIFLRNIVRQRIPLRSHTLSSRENPGYVEATHVQRLLNFCTDNLLLLLLFSGPAYELGSLIFPGPVWSGSAFGFIMVLLLIRFAYYYILETRFALTPAKFLSGTSVIRAVDMADENFPILLRTSIRFVPLNALSFIAGGRWHETWSGTRLIQVRSKTPAPRADSAADPKLYYSLNQKILNLQEGLDPREIGLISMEVSLNGRENLRIRLYKFGKVSRMGADAYHPVPVTVSSRFPVNHVFNNLIHKVTPSFLNAPETSLEKPQGPLVYKIAFYSLPDILVGEDHIRWGKYREFRVSAGQSDGATDEVTHTVISLIQQALEQTEEWYQDALIHKAYGMKAVSLPDETIYAGNKDSGELFKAVDGYLKKVLISSSAVEFIEKINEKKYTCDDAFFRACINDEKSGPALVFIPDSDVIAN